MAAANIVNIANTNVVGRNWILAIFNIFGDFNGDISFGKPDLWVGARAEVPADLHGGSCFTYDLTVTNFGDARASNVVLDASFDKALQVFDSFDEDMGTTTVRFNVGSLQPGSSRDITLPVCLTDVAGEGMTITMSRSHW
jgi:hypothetical protein